MKERAIKLLQNMNLWLLTFLAYMYNPYAISYYGYDSMSNNPASRFNMVNQGEGNPLAQQTPASAQSRLIGSVVNPMPIQDNSSITGIGQGSQSQALGMMNTPGVGQPQLQHGLIGRAFDNVKNNMLPFGGSAGVQQKLQGAMQQKLQGAMPQNSPGAMPQNSPNRDSTISNFIQNNKPQKPQNDQTGDYNNYV
jgi:hypothetical protein